MIAWLLVLALGGADAQEERRVLAELETAELQVAGLAEQVAVLEAREAELARQAAENAAALAVAKQDVAERLSAARERASALYRIKRRGLLRLLFGAEDPSSLRRRVRYLRAVLAADEVRTRELNASMEERRSANARVDADARLTQELRAELQTRLQELEARRDVQKRLLREIRSRNELATSVVRERAAAAASIQQTVVSDATVAAAVAGSTEELGERFRAVRGQLPVPVNGSVSRPYGPYDDPLTGAPVQNHGLDFSASMGAPIRAVFDGVVARAGYVRGYGQVVTVQHGAYATLYAHANGLRVATGQSVRAGEILGNVGTTGLVDEAPRLHFEVRYNGTPQDPAPWLGLTP